MLIFDNNFLIFVWNWYRIKQRVIYVKVFLYNVHFLLLFNLQFKRSILNYFSDWWVNWFKCELFCSRQRWLNLNIHIVLSDKEYSSIHFNLICASYFRFIKISSPINSIYKFKDMHDWKIIKKNNYTEKKVFLIYSQPFQ